MFSLRIVTFGILFLLLNGASAHSEQLSDLYAFGGSILDVGNIYIGSGRIFPPSPPYHNGRYGNGEMWIEMLARELELPIPTPSLEGGNDFAFGGAQTGPGWSTLGPIPNVGMQINMFRNQLGRFPEDALIAVSIGANDVRGGYTREHAINGLKGHLQELHDLGGRHFLITNYYDPVVDVGSLTELWNEEMPQFSLPDAMITRFDYAGLVEEIRTNPDAFGITNPVDVWACSDCGLGDNLTPIDIAPNPNEFVFWDEAHPSARMAEIMAERALELFQIPEPSTLDFNSDLDVDILDVDALVGGIVAGTNQGRFDLTGEGIVDNDDLSQWLSEAAMHNGFTEAYLHGDSNLDGSVDATDLNNLALNWRNEEDVARWSSGDFKSDGVVDSGDLNELALNWRQAIPTASTANASVPEPTTFFLTVIGLTLACRLYRSSATP